MSTESSPAPAPGVAAIVIASDAELLAPCLDAVGRQVYGLQQVIAVGGDDAVRRVAGDHEVAWRSNLAAALDAVGPDVEHVWIVRERARPLPDALGSLVVDGARSHASVVGSKVVDDTAPEQLVSVGFATDVFDAPYTGLQEGEVDQEQYDVIRDVAAVSGASMLIRRDLLRGLGGPDPALAPVAAAIDMCQRARLRGARVVVAPGSEVRYAGPDPAARWRERAGEIRSMLKVYSLITLVWAIPLVMLAGLVESVIAPFLGRWRLFDVLLSWAWNLARLPGTIAARLRARKGRVVGDEELFRYQVNGSARLRLLYDGALERFRTRFPEGVLGGFSDAVETGQQRIRRPSFVLAALTFIVAAVASREIWGSRLPAAGFSLPFPESSSDTLTAYAGGWNPAGLGSPEALRPFIGAIGMAQRVLFDSGGLAVAVVIVASLILGVFGTVRLLRVWGFGAPASYAAGLVLMAGPAVLEFTGDGHWVGVVAVAALPWAVSGALRPFPAGIAAGVGRMASIIATTGIVAAFAPAAMVLPVALITVWAALGTGHRWWAVGRAAVGLALSLPLLFPWILYARASDFLETGDPAYWEPPWLMLLVAGAVLLAVLIAADTALALIAGWGGIAAAGGVFLARTGGLGLGREVWLVGLIAASFGLAVVVGTAFEVGARRQAIGGLRLGAGVVGIVGSTVILLISLAFIAPGRAGLPSDDYRSMFAFASANDGSPSRVLTFGDALPGTTRDLEGLAYRVVDTPVPLAWSTYLGEPLLGDTELESVLLEILDGDVRRAGALLAPFGIEWVAFVDESPMETLFETQLDMVPLRSFDFAVFRNEVAAPVARGAESGSPWVADGTGFAAADGGAGEAVVVATNADSRWGPGEWSQAGWANAVGSGAGVAAFEPSPARRTAALFAGGWLVVLVVAMAAGWWVRRR